MTNVKVETSRTAPPTGAEDASSLGPPAGPAPPARNDIDGVAVICTPRQRPHRESLVGGLASAAVHLAVLIALGLVFSSIEGDGSINLEMALANASPSATIETFSMEPDRSHNAEDPGYATAAEPSFEQAIEEPTLNFDLGLMASAESAFDDANNMTEQTFGRNRSSGEPREKSGTFFGADAYGDEFVYVVDMSTSMGYRSTYGQTRFRIACRELLRSINELKSDQKFCVVMFCYRTRFMFDRPPRMLSATNVNKRRAAEWVNSLGLGGGTDPRYGVMSGLKLKPDAIFLLSDGEFNGRAVNSHGIRGNPRIERIIEQQRNSMVPIHTIAFEDLENRRRLRGIAAMTNGTHRFVGNVSDQNLVLLDLRSRKASDVAYAMQCLTEGTHKIRDVKHLRAIASLLTDKLTATKSALREKAHAAMATIANGDDMGPHVEEPAIEDYEEAQKEWKQYWQDYFRNRRLDQTKPRMPKLAKK